MIKNIIFSIFSIVINTQIFGAEIVKENNQNGYAKYTIILDDVNDQASIFDMDGSLIIDSIEDNRCPPNARCLWSGDFTVNGFLNGLPFVINTTTKQQNLNTYEILLQQVTGGYMEPYTIDVLVKTK